MRTEEEKRNQASINICNVKLDSQVLSLIGFYEGGYEDQLDKIHKTYVADTKKKNHYY
jgi:hypothetical protein